MQLEISGNSILIITMFTFIVSLILVPLVIRIAFHVNAIDEPNERKVHEVPMPRLGGLAIFLSFIFGSMFFVEPSKKMLAILLGGFIIILLGIADDIKPVKARYKFLFQLIGAAVVVIYGDISLSNISAFGINIAFGELSHLVAIIFIVGIINAINLIDGLDGLAAGISSIYFLTISIIGLMLTNTVGIEIVLCLLMLGATLGFLVYNFYPAKIFMGDTGSMFLGYMIAIIALLGFKAATFTSLLIPILLLFLPIIDTLFAIFRRLLKGENIGTPDKEHLHHQLLKLNKSPKKTVLIMYGISILCSIISILYTIGNNRLAMLLYIALIIAFSILAFTTDILFKQRKK